MSGEARKLYLIQALLKEEDEKKLQEIEALLLQVSPKPTNVKRPENFAGIWTEEEAEEIKKYIEEGCEQIHPDDWK